MPICIYFRPGRRARAHVRPAVPRGPARPPRAAHAPRRDPPPRRRLLHPDPPAAVRRVARPPRALPQHHLVRARVAQRHPARHRDPRRARARRGHARPGPAGGLVPRVPPQRHPARPVLRLRLPPARRLPQRELRGRGQRRRGPPVRPRRRRAGAGVLHAVPPRLARVALLGHPPRLPVPLRPRRGRRVPLGGLRHGRHRRPLAGVGARPLHRRGPVPRQPGPALPLEPLDPRRRGPGPLGDPPGPRPARGRG